MMVRKTTKGNSDSFSKRRAIMRAQRIQVRDENGQAFVELALVLPMLILLVVGGAEIGRLAYADIEISNAARAGVAYAMQSHAAVAASQYPNIENAAKQDAPNIPGLVVDPPILTCYCETSVGATSAIPTCDPTAANGANLTNCPSPSSIVIYVRVNTHAAIDTLFHLPAIPNSVTLRGTAIMRVEQD
jgi:Flp pilus assembly protein TadG